MRPLVLLAASIALLLASLAAPGAAETWLVQGGPYGGPTYALDRGPSNGIHALRTDGVFRTTDGGAHWDDLSAGASFTFLALDVTPSGAIWTGTSTRGVAWSLNGGASWTNDQIETNTHTGLGATITAIGVDPAGRILAGGYRSQNQGGSFQPMSIGGLCFAFDAAGQAIAGTMNGVWRSANGGASWTAANAGMEDARVLAVAVDGPAGIWAGTQEGEVRRSTDAGLTWAAPGAGLPGGAVVALEVLPGSALASVQGAGLFRTTDGGGTWSAAGAQPGEVRDLLLDGGDLWLATSGGVFRSTDGGATATPASAAVMFVPGHADLAADGAGALYLAAMGSGVFRSTDSGATWAPASSGLPSPAVAAVAGGAAGRAWAATWSGIAATTDAGATWAPSGFPGRRANEIRALGADVLLAGVDGELGLPAIQRSTDAGATWEEAWTDAFVFLLNTSAACSDGSVLFGGMSAFGGLVARSTDAGVTWADAAVGFSGIAALAAGAGGLAWAADGANVVHRSTDDGATWAPLPNGGWPTGTTGSLASLTRTSAGLLLVGTGDVYRSTDAGDTWAPMDDGFPGNAAVSFVAGVPSGVFAGTGSSGLFRLAGATEVAVLPVDVAEPRLRVAPNPFRDATRVSWELPLASVVRVVVYDVLGRRVAELAPGMQSAGAGSVVWDGRTTGGGEAAPGTYFVRWDAGGAPAGVKVLRVK